jgi:hypothetical protein
MAQPAAVKSASDDQVEQHSVPATVAYHLLPGVVILVVAIVFVPVAKAAGFPPIVGLLVGMLFGLSAQLGYLLWLGWKRNGRLSLAGVVLYRHRCRGGSIRCTQRILWPGVRSSRSPPHRSSLQS